MSAPRCGTTSGYSAHQKVGEKPCDACWRAKSEYDEKYRSAPERARKSRMHSRAQGRATTRLRAAFPQEWAVLYTEALAEVREEERNR